MKRKRDGRWSVIKFLSQRAKDYRYTVAEHVWEQLGRPPGIKERLFVIVTEHYGPRTETSRAAGQAQDIDNCIKPLFDAMEAAKVYVNDSQIGAMFVVQGRRAAVGRVEIEIRLFGDIDAI